MATASRDFQVFVKPIGSACNLNCRYCYYVKREPLCGKDVLVEEPRRMSGDILERYIIQHIEACPDPAVRFSWHGGEPTVLGLDYFRTLTDLQRKHLPFGRRIMNGMQTNGTLLDEDWCRFLARERFSVGLSVDGPKALHDCFRVTREGKPTHERAMRGYELLRRHRIPCDILCVVHAENVSHPLEVYRFFREIGAPYLGFLPLVERQPEQGNGVSSRTVPAEAYGAFLCAIFDEWLRRDVGRIRVQIFEEVAETALGREHALCVFQKTCGNVPVIEHNGDFYCCDHFVDGEHLLGNIQETSLVELIESPGQRGFGETKLKGLPRYCRDCTVLGMCNGGCPKDRFIRTPDGEEGLNYLCAGYRRFFTHCLPFAAELAAVQRGHVLEARTTPGPPKGSAATVKAGRNDPCPCGSGKKYKKCCMGK